MSVESGISDIKSLTQAFVESHIFCQANSRLRNSLFALSQLWVEKKKLLNFGW